MSPSLGRQGEQDALDFLIDQKGYSFIDRNFRTRWGELDLILKDPEGTLVFVEVKARVESSAGDPLEHIDGQKLQHLRLAIQLYLFLQGWSDRSCRLDAIGVEYARDTHDENRLHVTCLRHIQDLTGW